MGIGYFMYILIKLIWLNWLNYSVNCHCQALWVEQGGDTLAWDWLIRTKDALLPCHMTHLPRPALHSFVPYRRRRRSTSSVDTEEKSVGLLSWCRSQGNGICVMQSLLTSWLHGCSRVTREWGYVWCNHFLVTRLQFTRSLFIFKASHRIVGLATFGQKSLHCI